MKKNNERTTAFVPSFIIIHWFDDGDDGRIIGMCIPNVAVELQSLPDPSSSSIIRKAAASTTTATTRG